MDIEKINQSVENISKSPKFKTELMVIVVVAAVLLIFALGVSVGLKKADFSYRWGENYHMNFGGPRGGFVMMGNYGMPNPHGTFGKIISISFPTIMLTDQKNAESTVLITDDTDIHQFRSDIKKEDLKIGEYVVVLGEPNDKGQIEARLIRVMPAPQTNMTASSSPKQ